MSGTRSASQKAQATSARNEALLIAAHGDRGGSRDNALARAIASTVAETGRYRDVGVGYVRGTPGLAEAALEFSAPNLRVYPLFLSNGYYVNTAIPERLGVGGSGQELQCGDTIIMPPLGVSKRMPSVLADLALGTAQTARLAPEDCSVLFVAHGSTKDQCSRHATEQMIEAVDQTGMFRSLHAAYLEEPPFLGEQLTSLPGPLIVVGLFIGTGMHGGDDLKKAKSRLQRADVFFASPLAHAPGLRHAIMEDLVEAQ